MVANAGTKATVPSPSVASRHKKFSNEWTPMDLMDTNSGQFVRFRPLSLGLQQEILFAKGEKSSPELEIQNGWFWEALVRIRTDKYA